jgi:hypothetical protein
MQGMDATSRTVPLQLKAIRIITTILLRCIVSLVALSALQSDNHPYRFFCHFRLKGGGEDKKLSLAPLTPFYWSVGCLRWTDANRSENQQLRSSRQLSGTNYSMILVMTPAPTVRPPSRMAKRLPASNATGTINSTFRFTLSPGITISTPSGNCTLPVTSMVRM